MSAIRYLIIISLTVGFLSLTNVNNKNNNMINIEINLNEIAHEMAGGIGASWHAISKEIPLQNEKYDYPVREVNPRGSAYGGNPPVSNTDAWQQIYKHAEWLGLNWLRVELSQRMYEPQRKMYDWDNEEMQALYNILDWCERNNADVFLQQMWGYVDWNAYEGVHPLLSAPRSLDDFAESIARLLLHLTKEKQYTCIKYFSIVNEPPGGTWGYWWSYGAGSGSVTDAWKRVSEELVKRGIDIPLSGPDWTDLPPFDTDKIDFDNYIGAYDIHSYHGIGIQGEKNISDWVNWAHQHQKPFFLTELGNMNLGWGTNNPGPKSFEAALSNAEDIIRCLNQKVDAINRWSFTNRGDLDGQWQLITTYDRTNKRYVGNIQPEKEAYYGIGIITRFLAKYAKVIKTKTDNDNEHLHYVALVNPDDKLVMFLLNKNEKSQRVKLSFKANAPEVLHHYFVTENKIREVEDPVKPTLIDPVNSNSLIIDLAPKSISTITEYSLDPSDQGILTIN